MFFAVTLGTCVLQTSDQAAASLWTGISRGHYQITSDFAVELLRISNNSTNPRNNFLLELLLLPFACIMQHLFHIYMEFIVKRSSIPNKRI
jgi:hypothetical protein